MEKTQNTDKTCDCGSGLTYGACCEPYISGEKKAPTAEALMRSRYTAYVHANISYIKSTLAPEKRKEFDESGAKEWATKSKWMGLEIMETKQGQPSDSKGVVEFTATYKLNGKTIGHHEVAEFRQDKTENRWYFVDAESHEHADGHGHHHHAPTAPVVRAEPKIGRNDPCSCGSGLKYKKCHGAA
jgi:SEC-C motif domain protein